LKRVCNGKFTEGKIKGAKPPMELWMIFGKYPEHRREWEDLVGHREGRKKHKYGWKEIIMHLIDA
jgi:hypothetical protein